MTASEIAKSLKGRRYAKGKWMARCPAHPDRTGSLSICEMPDGVRVHCFSGCSKKSVLDVMGLTWKDLKHEERRTDPEILRQIRDAESKRETDERRRRDLKNHALLRASVWNATAQGLGRLMAHFPWNDRLAVLFHQALDYQRRCESIADAFDIPCARGHGSPPLPKRRKLRAEDVNHEIAIRLGLIATVSPGSEVEVSYKSTR